MPVNLTVARCKVATMKSRYQFCWLLILYLLELSIVSSAIDQAAERHIDDVDVHFQEYHLEDDFKPSEVLGPIDGFQQSGPIIIRGEDFSWSKPKKPHWLGGSSNFDDSGPRNVLYRDDSVERSDQLLTPLPRRPHRRVYSGSRRRRPNRNRRRRKHRHNQNRQSGSKSCGPAGSDGVCRNFMSCMFSGRRLDFQADQGRNCDDMFSVCCTKWPSTFSSPSLTRKKRKRNRPQKAGRALFNGGSPPVQTPNVIQYYTNPEKFGEISVNSITSSGLPVPHLDGSTNQWHTHSVVTSPDEENCGLSKNAQRKIMGGLDAGYGQFPWTAHIKIRGPNIDKVCGGTLVNMRWIVTAGHCTQYCQDVPHCVGEISQAGNYSQPELNTPSDLFIPKTNYKSEANIQYKVILGEYDQLSQLEEYPPESYLVVEVVRHPEYRNVMRYHYNGFLESEPRFDVALLRLDRPVRRAPNVAPICLPPLNNYGRGSISPPGTLATVVGWGRLGRDEDAPHSNVLQAVTVPVLDDNDCAYQTGLGVYTDQMCAGGSDVSRSACPGDSGGGLQVRDVQRQGRWTLVGVVSNGPSTCGLQPVIFHKIEETLPWIVRTMRSRVSHLP